MSQRASDFDFLLHGRSLSLQPMPAGKTVCTLGLLHVLRMTAQPLLIYCQTSSPPPDGTDLESPACEMDQR